MTTSQAYEYTSPTIHLCAPGYSHCAGELKISVDGDNDGISSRSAILALHSGGAHLQLYPTAAQMDQLILAATKAKAALMARMALPICAQEAKP